MDAHHFDRLTRSLTEAATRRGLLGLLATLPVLGGLLALLNPDESDAKGRRKRRKKRHKHGKGRRRQHHKQCKAESKTKTCNGKCGPVVNNCRKTVDCGSCDCTPPCKVCFICQSGPNTPGSCVVDPDLQGQPCGGSDGQVCQPDGACACDAGSCPADAPICAGGLCIGCGTDGDCAAASLGDLCCDGACFSGVCCADATCSTADAPDCVDHQCTCGGDPACAGDPELCCAGECVDTDSDESNCGSCGTICGGGELCCTGSCESGVCCADADCTSEEAPDCVAHACVCAANSNAPCDDGLTCCDDGCVDVQTNHAHCGACGNACGAEELCVDGACQACDVCLSGECNFTSVQAAIDATTPQLATIYVCPGSYLESSSNPNFAILITRSLRLIGAGDDGPDTTNTHLRPASGQRVVGIGGAAASPVTLENLRITGGNGAISCGLAVSLAAHATLRNVTIAGNTATVSGNVGGLSAVNDGTQVTLLNSRITGNTGTSAGGINVNGGVQVFFDSLSRVTGNTATSSTGNGGIVNNAGMVDLPSVDNVTGNINPPGRTNCAGNGTFTGPGAVCTTTT